MQAYLFVHFKEKRTPDGEQVYFAVSQDGFKWESVNDGNPVLWSYQGEKGVRDFTIVRTREGKFCILATDLSLAYNMEEKYHNSWREVSEFGSRNLMLWESEDLVHWSKQRVLPIGDDDFGCVWAPDVIYDKKQKDYVLHWSSAHRRHSYDCKEIYYSRTKDFKEFSSSRLLYEKPEQDGLVIDSAMYEEDGFYYMFLKSERNPGKIILVKSNDILGPFERVEAFDKSMEPLEENLYEAPTAVRLENGKWCLFLDYYGCSEEEQGYVPFLADSLASGKFERAEEAFSFPYGFKHGTILKITMEEYERLKQYRKQPSER